MAARIGIMDAKVKGEIMKKAQKKKTLIVLGSIIAVVLIGIAVFFGAKAIYNNGVSKGRQLEAEEIADKIESLGDAISERESFKAELSELVKDLPSEVDSDGIDLYIEKLKNLVEKVSTKDVKNLLEEYYNQWLNFKEVYLSENNDEITNSFNELKTKTKELSESIKAKFNESIKNSLEGF